MKKFSLPVPALELPAVLVLFPWHLESRKLEVPDGRDTGLTQGHPTQLPHWLWQIAASRQGRLLSTHRELHAPNLSPSHAARVIPLPELPPRSTPLASPLTVSSSTQHCIYKLGHLGRLSGHPYSWESICH